MNWLTYRVTDLPDFAEMVRDYLPITEDGFGRVPAQTAFDIVHLSVPQELAWVGREAYILLEHEAAAAQRLTDLPEIPSSAVETWPQKGEGYTVSFPVGLGMVTHLPENDRPELTVQVFVDTPDGTTRINLEGSLPDDFGGTISTATQSPVPHCSDGACGKYMPCTGCAGCACSTFSETGTDVRSRLWQRGAQGHIWVSRCYCDQDKLP